jgi:hypothetical protein
MPQIIGMRVEIPPHLDAWMRGDRYGEIVSTMKTKPSFARVKLDKSGKVVAVHMDYLTPVA